MKHFLLAGSLLAAAVAAPVLARDLTIQDVVQLSRVGAPAVSPDGHWLVWQQRETDLAANKGRYDLWRLDLTTKGAAPEKLVAEAEVNETAPQFSPDGKTLYFQSACFSLLAAMGKAEAEDLGLDGGPLYNPADNFDRVSRKMSDWGSDPEPVGKGTRTNETPAQTPEVKGSLDPLLTRPVDSTRTNPD